MLIQKFTTGPIETNSYVIACTQTHHAVIIDAPPSSFQKIESYLKENQLSCQKLLLTHSHWDHIANVRLLQDKLSLPVYIHAHDLPNLEKPGSDGLTCWMEIPATKTDYFLIDGMQIAVGDLSLNVIHTPGHSPGSVCFYEEQHHLLFTGDTLFAGGYGNISFPMSHPASMKISLAKLGKIPTQTKVYPGHGIYTTIQAELALLCDPPYLN